MWRRRGTLRSKTVQADGYAPPACPVSLIQRAYRRGCALYAPVTNESRQRVSGVRGAVRQKSARRGPCGAETSAESERGVNCSSDRGLQGEALLHGRQETIWDHRLAERVANGGEELADLFHIQAGHHDDVLER